LLEVDADPQALLQVGRLRLAAAGRIGYWPPIDKDLTRLARKIPLADESAWLYYLATCSHWVVWNQPWPLAAHLRDELKRLRHLELAHAEVFDQVEASQHEARMPASFQELPWSGQNLIYFSPAWIALVPIAWADGDLRYSEAQTAIEQTAADPATAIRAFDRYQREFGGAVLVQLAGALQRMLYLRGNFDDEFAPDLIRGLASRLPEGWHRGYANYRMELLSFLMGNRLGPREFSEACLVHPDFRVRTISGQLRDDLSLHLTWLACTLREAL
jgi:hypothetical protein